jgi:uncharacterized protein YjeT (DUF2065 family)
MKYKHHKTLWLAISIIAVLAMIFFTVAPALYY